MRVYSIFDRKAQSYEMPTLMLFRNDELAKRAIGSALNAGQLGGLFGAYPEDFELYLLGEFDQNTGDFKQDKSYVCALVDLKEKKDAE